jgi:hypothetical protein
MTELNQLDWQRTNLDNIEEAWKGDLWDRRRLGEQLTNYVDRLQCGAVLALDARWGEGKTWFVRHWQKHLENEGHNVIYLDAFANDYLDDPFLVVTSEITNILSKDKKTKGKVKKLIDLSASVGSALLPSLPKIALTLGLHLIGAGFFNGVLQQGYENAKDEIDKLSDEASDRIKESIQEKIAGHEAEKKTLSEFKKHLAETVVKLDKPLVFIIDELDRCRPDFAIRLIERIKHFFDIPKIVFVLVINKKQFVMGIKRFYGYDDDSSKLYLDKFIDFEVPLLNDKNILSKNIASFEIIRQLMLAVGEECSDIHLVFHLGLKENISFRELKKKVNIYALLKQESVYKNLFISLSLVKSNSGLIRSMKDVIILILKLNEINRNIVDANLRNTHNDIFISLVKQNYSLELGVLLEYISDLKEIEIENQKNNSENYKVLFSKVMNKYALKYEENMEAHIFEQQFIKYLSSSL